MVLAKLSRFVVLPAVAALLVAGPPKVSDKSVVKWTNQQLKDILVVPEERIFDRIGWADNLLQAEELAKKSGRPLFFFMYDGDIAAGRC
jgi:hypothetical protein